MCPVRLGDKVDPPGVVTWDFLFELILIYSLSLYCPTLFLLIRKSFSLFDVSVSSLFAVGVSWFSKSSNIFFSFFFYEPHTRGSVFRYVSFFCVALNSKNQFSSFLRALLFFLSESLMTVTHTHTQSVSIFLLYTPRVGSPVLFWRKWAPISIVADCSVEERETKKNEISKPLMLSIIKCVYW